MCDRGVVFLFANCLLDGLLNCSLTLKMEAIRSSETSGATQRTTRRHIPEDDALHVKFLSWRSVVVFHMDHMNVSFRIVECTRHQLGDHNFIKFNNESLEYFESNSSLLLLANQRCASQKTGKYPKLNSSNRF
jgi:hypothetical protein